MATKLSPNVPRRVLELDRPRTIALTLGALRRIKEVTGSSDVALSEDEVFDRAPALIWAALVDSDREDVTPDDVEGMLHAGNLAAVVGALSELAAQRDAKGAEGNAAVPAPPKVKGSKK